MAENTRLDPVIVTALRDVFARNQPRSTLLLGDTTSALIECLPVSHAPPERRVLQPEGDPPAFSFADQGRFDLALAGEELFAQPKAGIEQTLARLRDVHARAICLHWRTEWSGACSKHDLLAFAMRRVDAGREDATEHLFLYDIRTYKDTPDWLTSRHWAHPERWDKERW